MPRGRPRKIKPNIDNSNNDENIVEIPRQKRKYTKRVKPEQKLGSDGSIIKPLVKKRGRKRGRKKKEDGLIYTPEEVIDFMIRNYPDMRIDEIKDDVLEGLKRKKKMGDDPYVLDKFIYNGVAYWYDSKDAILNSDAKIVGYFIKQDNGSKKIYMIKSDDDDDILLN